MTHLHSHDTETARRNGKNGGGSRSMDAVCPFCDAQLDQPLPYHLPCEAQP